MQHGELSIVWIDQSNRDLLNSVADGVFDEPIRQDRLSVYLQNPSNWMAVALMGDKVVGQCMCVVHHHPDKETELYLDEIGSGDDWLRKGVASALMQAVFARADEAGIEEIWLGTEADNVPAQRLYKKPERPGSRR
jgi:aminoglycoside 6'-N-acetyltransferase I